jgi:hypothetical protein
MKKFARKATPTFAIRIRQMASLSRPTKFDTV